MTTRAFPSITPNDSVLTFVSNSRQFLALSGAIQEEQRAGRRWLYTMDFSDLSGAERARLQGFVVQVLGNGDNFTVYDHAHRQQGALGGTPVTSGTTAAGATSLSLSGGPTSQTDYLKAGDQFEVAGELKMVTADVDTDGSGLATVSFMPEVRGSISAATSINLTNPTGVFRFGQREIGWRNRRGGLFTSFTLECIEDVLA
jgi:hypothetical protein